jgi:hypothetical protein
MAVLARPIARLIATAAGAAGHLRLALTALQVAQVALEATAQHRQLAARQSLMLAVVVAIALLVEQAVLAVAEMAAVPLLNQRLAQSIRVVALAAVTPQATPAHPAVPVS